MKRLYMILMLLLTAAYAAESPSKGEWTPLPASAWHWYGHKKEEGFSPIWTVEADGSFHRKPGKGKWEKGDLITDDGTWRNFVLELEWKISKGANSGIFYRIKDGLPMPSPSGFECQILDDNGFQNGKALPIHRAGSLYSIIPANEQKELKPLGEWNTLRIIADGEQLEHWLNGKCVLKVNLTSPEFKNAFAKSSWKGNPAKGAAPNGFIALQDHGGEVWYRNIRIKKLPEL